MKKVLVIVPFPMSEENLNFRREQLKAIPVSSNLSFTFRPVKAAPRNYVSQADMVLADIGVLETGLSAEKEGFSAVCVDTMSDSVFQRTTQFSIQVFDHVERLDETSESGRLFLKFEPAEQEQAPEDTTVLATR